MIGDLIETFRTTPAVNQKFVENVKLIQVAVTVSHAGKVDLLIMNFQSYAILQPNGQEIHAANNAKRNEYLLQCLIQNTDKPNITF